MSTWRAYQDRVASFFQALGLEAATDVTLMGVRTKHDIDVLVKAHHVGFEVVWLVECKQWKTRVSKLHVLALREIVSDLGADRGILLSEAGFQSGAFEAANLTNVRITSLEDLHTSAASDFQAMHMRDLYARVEQCGDRYWAISKGDRIKYGLRFDIEVNYSGSQVVNACRDLLSRAFRGLYPFFLETIAPSHIDGLQKRQFSCPQEVISVVEPMIVDLEARLDSYDSITNSSAFPTENAGI